MRLALLFAAAFAAISLTPAEAAPDVRLAPELIAENLSLPVALTAPAGDPRLFVVEQTGRIQILIDGKRSETPFLDLTGNVSSGNEQGLLGLAFHPDYATNGRFFIDYTDRDGTTRIVAYKVSADPNVADPASAVELISIKQPFANHNGGWIAFGPDGLLYIGMGDGGAGGDPGKRAQNPDELLGKILRIDVDGAAPYTIPPGNPFAAGGGAPEIFALGVRNPWRNAVAGDHLIIADVGQDKWEEVSIIPLGQPGANLGWNRVEGPACFRAKTCDMAGLVAPVYSYAHADGGCSITGGEVYRGKAIPELAGQYFFADFCAGFVRSFVIADGKAGEVTDWTPTLGVGAITSFGTDATGELYLTTIEGNLFRIARAR